VDAYAAGVGSLPLPFHDHPHSAFTVMPADLEREFVYLEREEAKGSLLFSWVVTPDIKRTSRLFFSIFYHHIRWMDKTRNRIILLISLEICRIVSNHHRASDGAKIIPLDEMIESTPG
jgi:hypothetical protein